MRRTATALAALLTALSTNALAEPLRHRVPLIAQLADARVDPPLTKRDLDDPCKVESYENPYSPLPEPMRRRHQRVTAASKKATVELVGNGPLGRRGARRAKAATKATRTADRRTHIHEKGNS